MLKMAYALKGCDLVHISEVENGLKCGCVCPSCDSKLIARKGSIKIHHFAHATGEDCKRGIETVLHMMAKSILERERRIKIPKVYILTKFTETYHGSGHWFPRTIEEYMSEDKYIEFDRVELEKKVDSFIPDIALYSNNQCLLVEIKVSNGIDDNKLQKIRDTGVSLLEIDLSGLKDTITEDELRGILVDTLENKNWVYNRRAEYYKETWLGLCEKFKPIKRMNTKGKYEHYRTVYQIDDCPLCKGVYNEKPYANVKGDCFRCEYCIDIEYEPYSYDDDLHRIVWVYCCGRKKISSADELKFYLQKKTKA